MNYFSSLILFCLLAGSLANFEESEDFSNNYISGRVVGGNLADEGAFPYQVSLQVNGKHFCGGSIISQKFVMTAGHCLQAVTNRKFMVVVGTTNLSRGGIEYEVKRTIIHPNYDVMKLTGDIGLIEVTQNITQTSKVAPVSLPTSDFTKTDTPVVSSGFGKTWVLGKPSMQLKYLNTKVFNQKLCRLIGFKRVTDKNICTISRIGKGVCHGDSGGPLVANGVQVGVVSWGLPCALGVPDIYTRVYSYVEWINGYLKN